MVWGALDDFEFGVRFVKSECMPESPTISSSTMPDVSDSAIGWPTPWPKQVLLSTPEVSRPSG
eukprot:7291155-Pyramimonas_sp.AAC.1